MKAARPRVCWLHVHYFDAPGRRDLAVQYTTSTGRRRYLTAKRIDGPGFSFVRRGNRQPRAVVKVRGVVRRRPGGVLAITRT